MNKSIIIALIAIVVIAAGGAAAYVLTKDSSNESSSNAEDTSNAADATIADIAGSSISKLLGAGVARKCTFSDESSNGTIYFTSNNRMRTDYTTTDAEQSSGSMIILTDRQYFWDNDTKEGVVMAFDASSEGGTDHMMDEDESQSVDINEEYDFKCSIWRTDESLLTPPADVTFTDMAAMMQGAMQ